MKVLDTEKLSYSAELLRAISHPLRLSILVFIDRHKEINVNQIYRTLKLEQSITSQHLRILRKADLVISKRDGKYIFYSLNYEKLEHLNDVIKSFSLLQTELVD